MYCILFWGRKSNKERDWTTVLAAYMEKHKNNIDGFKSKGKNKDFAAIFANSTRWASLPDTASKWTTEMTAFQQTQEAP